MTWTLLLTILLAYFLGMLCGFAMGRYHELTRCLDLMAENDDDGGDGPPPDVDPDLTAELACQNWRDQ